MGKYQRLWEHIQQSGQAALKLSFSDIEAIAGVPIDHSFLKYKKELPEYGYQVEKISMKEQAVIFGKVKEEHV